MKKNFLVIATVAIVGWGVGLYCLRGGHCTECHCKSGGMCCCSGVCKPECTCPNCNCK